MVNWNVSKEDLDKIQKIVKRARALLRLNGPATFRISMDITAVHLNGNPLDLQKLLEADAFNFLHDVSGISIHVDRETGKLKDFFCPRCSA